MTIAGFSHSANALPLSLILGLGLSACGGAQEAARGPVMPDAPGGDIAPELPATLDAAPALQHRLNVELYHGTLGTSFPNLLEPSDDVVVARDGAQLSFGLRQLRYVDAAGASVGRVNLARSEANRSGSSIVYRGVAAGTDLVYRAVHGEVKQLLMLNQRPPVDLLDVGAKTLEVVEQVNFAGLTPVVDGAAMTLPARFETRSEILLQREGRTLFTIPAPMVTDAAGHENVGSFRVNLDEDGRGVMATVVPMDYLQAPERAYPLAIDPSVVGHACDVDEHCDDGNPCTADTCDAGGCAYALTNEGGNCWGSGTCVSDATGLTNPDDWCAFDLSEGPECIDDSGCADGNPCTLNTCVDGACESALDPAHPEGSACFGNGVCGPTGECVVPGEGCTGDAECNDGSPCTDDSCDAGSCVNAPANEGDSCFGNGTCTAGVCELPDTGGVGGCTLGLGDVCNDGNPCTDDSCNATTGDCEYTAVNEGDACFGNGTCEAGECVAATAGPGGCNLGLEQVCNDGNPCTEDSCDAGSGDCTHTATNEGDTCWTSGTCAAGVCVFGTGVGGCTLGGPETCNDGNPCTADSCNAATGDCENVIAGVGDTCWQSGTCSAAGECEF